MSMPAKKNKHPYITINKKIRDGEPIIAGTGIRVLDVALRYEIGGMSPDDIIIALPHLSLSQVHGALSYYYENKAEIDKRWKDAIKEIKTLKKKTPSVLEKKV